MPTPWPTPLAAGASFVDPNPAVTRTGLVANPSPGNSELWQIDPMIAFLSADEPKLTFARTLRVVESAVAREAVRRCGRGGDVEPVWMDVRSELLCGLRAAVGTNGRGMAGAHRHSPELDQSWKAGRGLPAHREFRLRCYQLHIGLDAMTHNAFTGRLDDLARNTEQTMALI